MRFAEPRLREVELPGHAEAVVEPAELAAEAVAAERHERGATFGERGGEDSRGLAALYKQINAPVGQLSLDSVKFATNATLSTSSGDATYIDYFLASMKRLEDKHHRRLVHMLDVHWYPEAKGAKRITEKDVSPKTVEARLQAPRSLWDPTYVEKSWIAHLFQTDVGQPVFDLLDAQYWQHRIDYFQEEYGDLVRGHNAEGTAVVLHGYDWLIPTGDGVTFDGFWKGKPWVRPAMLDANIIDVGRQNALGKKIVEDFNDLVIAPLADGARFPDGRLKVTYVNCRDAVKPASEWANELHPTPTGFKEVAARFVPLLPDLLP